jgi:hypothetical protein
VEKWSIADREGTGAFERRLARRIGRPPPAPISGRYRRWRAGAAACTFNKYGFWDDWLSADLKRIQAA